MPRSAVRAAVREQRSTTRARRLRGERGVALLEFAIGFAFLGIVVFGTIDLGRAFITWNQVKNAAREGAAYAERDPWSQSASGGGCADPDNITHRAQTENGSRRPELAVTTTHDGAAYSGCHTPSSLTINPGDKIEVRVSTPFTPLSPLGAAIFGSPAIHAEVEVVVQ